LTLDTNGHEAFNRNHPLNESPKPMKLDPWRSNKSTPDQASDEDKILKRNQRISHDRVSKKRILSSFLMADR
jgi:hypothetical protein